MSLQSCFGKLKNPKSLPAADRAALLKSIEGLPIAKQDAAALKAISTLLIEAKNNVKYLQNEIIAQHGDKLPKEAHDDAINYNDQPEGVSAEPSGESVASAEQQGREVLPRAGKTKPAGLEADRHSDGKNDGRASDVTAELKAKIKKLNDALDNTDTESTKYKVMENQLAKAKNELRRVVQATPEAKKAEEEAEGYN